MEQTFWLEKHAGWLSEHRRQRGYIRKVGKILWWLRRARIPVYKAVYDQLNFRSYYEVLKRILEWKKGGQYFEWGPGLNTTLAHRTMAKVYSVEHDRYWYTKYQNQPGLIFSPISNESCLSYPDEIKKVQGPVDVAFVDGRCRVQCVKASAEAKVSIVIIHDSLDIPTLKASMDGPPPAGNDGRPYSEGFKYYKYYIEVVDLRTIVLMNREEDFSFCKNLFSDFYLRTGLTEDYSKP